MSIKRISILLYGLALTATQVACLPGQNSGVGFEASTKLEINPPVEPIVCDPFDEDGIVYRQHGLSGKFYYLNDSMPRYESVGEYINHGVLVDRVTLFLNRLFVPTRAFDLGFMTQDGNVLKNDRGDTLYEYFALKLESSIMLQSLDNHVGNYQFAILSDDGSTLQVQRPGSNNYEMLVDNDGTHPTRFKVSTQPLNLDRNSRVPMKLQYYQGPRHHISMTMMFRPWPTNPNEVIDPLDGYASNEDFFDSTQVPSVEQPMYQQLLGRGWKPLDTRNFLLREVQNPCSNF